MTHSQNPNLLTDPYTFNTVHVNYDTNEKFVVDYWSTHEDKTWDILRSVVDQIENE